MFLQVMEEEDLRGERNMEAIEGAARTSMGVSHTP